MTADTVIQIALIATTLLGLGLILYQIRSAQRDVLIGSLISSAAEHWMLYEDRRMQIRTGEMQVHYPRLHSYLKELLSSHYQDNVSMLAEAFLPGDQSEVIAKGTDAVLDAIVQEYAVNDLYFNLCEEEFLAGKYLKLARGDLWDYWNSYISENFHSEVRRNHWELRKAVGITFPAFAEFVEQNYLSKPHS